MRFVRHRIDFFKIRTDSEKDDWKNPIVLMI
jgi:hypothetical protein